MAGRGLPLFLLLLPLLLPLLLFPLPSLATNGTVSTRHPRSSSYNTSLSRSMSTILQTILSRMDKRFRPFNNDSKNPLVVEVDISVRSIGPISEQRQEFSMDCYFRQKWTDSRLTFSAGALAKDSGIPLSSEMLKEIWTPDTYIRNGRQSYLHTLTVPNILFRVTSSGEVTVSQRLTIRARCPMFLTKFPMDSQACPIEIGSLGYFDSDIVYVWKDGKDFIDNKMGNMLAQYQLVDTWRRAANVVDYRTHKNISVLQVFFKLQRQQGFYILQIYTPCTLLVIMSWVSFWINKEASPARVALGIMTVLSMSTLGFGLRTDLPKVSHSTALDIYIISCFGFAFAAMVEYAVINYAHIVYIRKKVHELAGLESNKAMDSMRMFTASIMGARRETIQTEDLKLSGSKKPWYSRILRRKEAETTSVFYRMAVKAAKAREKLKMRDPAVVVNRIDDVSKVVFPVLYIVFNLIYWLAYLYLLEDEINAFYGNDSAPARL